MEMFQLICKKHKWDACRRSRRNFKTMSKLKCSIYSHHKWIYCIFIKLNEQNGYNKTNESSIYDTYEQSMEYLWKKCFEMFCTLHFDITICDTHSLYGANQLWKKPIKLALLIRLKLTNFEMFAVDLKLHLIEIQKSWCVYQSFARNFSSEWQWNYRKCFYEQMQLNYAVNILSIK